MRSVGEGWKTRNPNPDDESLLEDDVDEGKHEHKGQQGEGYWRCLRGGEMEVEEEDEADMEADEADMEEDEDEAVEEYHKCNVKKVA